MARKKRELTPLGLSFLDCICCGFGAVLLLFILANGKQQHQAKQAVDTNKLSLVQQQYEQTLASLEAEQQSQTALHEQKERELLAALKKVEAQKKAAQLRAKATETKPETEPAAVLSVPHPVNRQYLTDFKRAGERVLILLEASGGMFDTSVEQARSWSKKSPSSKQQAPKWQSAVKATEWILAQLSPPTQYQIYTFNKTTQSVLPATTGSWLDLKDQTKLSAVVDALRAAVPQQGANLERAFSSSRDLKPRPDNIILITDGLPTLSDSIPAGIVVNPTVRQRMFQAAVQNLPIAVPVNTLLFPMSGDPDAAAYYWRLACRTNGAFICPAKDWPLR